jgi:DNA helicase HerA-like ATPase
VITLDEISNTKATLAITELYLTCLLHYARDHQETCPKVLVVVEEAHTVMPEPTTMGLGDYDSRGLVSKIAQIALQGRKYGVGLLVIAQRTATVSKTVLTQCNTMITLNCFDETSLGFLSNVYGSTHTQLIANLPRLHAVVFGRAVRSERPIVVEIPYDAKKAAKPEQAKAVEKGYV